MNDGAYHMERYQRQVLLKELGTAGQLQLQKAKVLMIGAGGLGCPALQYLAAAGIGTIGIVDHDVVDISNLHRQILYRTNDIGLSKAEQAATVLQQLNPDCHIEIYDLLLTNKDALDIIAAYDVVIDGTDNFATRYMVNDACVLLGKPLVYGSISQFEGQVAVFNVADEQGLKVNYRHLFPQPPAPGEVLNCAEAGVLGVLPGIIGTLQASETIKLITGIGAALINRLFTYNALDNQTHTFQLQPETTNSGPADENAFRAMNYDWFCGVGREHDVEEIDAVTFKQWQQDTGITFIDVREPGEQPIADTFIHQQLPLSSFEAQVATIAGDTVVVFCQSGKRSLKAAGMIREVFGDRKKIFSLRGGILSTLTP